MAMKQMESTKAKVGELNFYITPFPAFKAANLTGELASVLAPLLGVLAPLVTSEGEGLMDIDVNRAAEAMSGCTAISGDKLELLMRKLLIGGNIVVEVPDENGTIELGKNADLVVCEKNIYDIAHDEIKTTKIDMTVLAGRTVFERN